ncbi:MAG: amidohydrolase family protein [Chitinispirillaceae bacterium]|nr:amidohydrolase family protein [Chitinispirillaceae bacterium]
MIETQMIIDCHCHFGIGEGFSGPWDTRASLKEYLKEAIKVGITHTVLFPIFSKDYLKANYKVAKFIEKFPNRFYGFAFVHPVRDEKKIFSIVKKMVETYNFVGIKVHRYDGKITREICEVARFFSLPVLYDPMGEISICELLASEYPDVNFIIPHLGRFGDNWEIQSLFISYLSKYPNIYTDTSSVLRFDLLKKALESAGPHKILFGSDGPWLHPALELMKIKLLKLSFTEEKLILGKNFLKLISRISKIK